MTAGIDDLEAPGVVEHTRDGRDGHGSRYRVNDDSRIATPLSELRV